MNNKIEHSHMFQLIQCLLSELYFTMEVELALDLISILFLDCDPLLELQVLAVRRLITGDLAFSLGVSTSSRPVIYASRS